MATVRMSRNVSEEIQKNAKKAYQKTNPYLHFDATMGDRIYADLYTEAKEILNKVRGFEHINSSNIVESNERINIQIEGIDTSEYLDPTSNSSYGGRSTYYDAIDVPLTRKQWFFNQNGRDKDVTVPKSNPIHAEIMKMLDHNEQVYQGYEENRSKVQEIIDACVTINQFLKAWPAGAALVPEEALQKANERSVRKQQAEERRALVEGMETDLNTTILTSSLLED